MASLEISRASHLNIVKTNENDLSDDQDVLMPYLKQKLSLCGCWPITHANTYRRWLIIAMVLLSSTIPTIIGATKLAKTNLIEFTQAMCEVCAITSWTFKMIYLSYHWNDIVRVVKTFQDVWDKIYKVEIPEWQNIVKASQKFVQQVSVYVCWLYLIVGVTYEVVALWVSMKRQFFDKSGEMIYGIHANFIIDTQHNFVLYLIIYVPLFVVQAFYCVIYAGIELFILFLTNYYALYFKFIQIKLRKLNEKLKSITPAHAKQEIIEIIKEHEIAMECVNSFEAIINIVLLATFVMNSFIICFFVFAFFKLIQDSIANFIIFIGFALAIHIALVWLSYFGQKLLDESADVGNTAWNMTWYDEDVEFQHLIRFIVMRSQRPVGLTAAGFYFISLQSYYNVLKTAYSYFTLMNSVIFGNKLK